MTRVRLGVLTTVLAVVGALALAGCGHRAGSGANGGSSDSADYTDLDVEGQALEAIGFSSVDLVPLAAVAEATSTPSPGARPGKQRPLRHKRLRFGFGQRMLHGEAVVQTDQGTRTVVAQRGTVTAITDTSVTVKSADGFTLTWTFGNPIHVLEHRNAVQPSAVKVGTAVGVAGGKDGDTAVARLIVIPRAK